MRSVEIGVFNPALELHALRTILGALKQQRKESDMESDMESDNIPNAILEELPQGTDLSECTITTYGELEDAEDDGFTSIHDDAIAVILPGWIADDGNAEVEYPDADSGEDAAREYVADGCWGSSNETGLVKVYAWRVGYTIDEEGFPVEIRIDRNPHMIEIEPEEPDCSNDDGHDWQAPHEIVGGMEENPGVIGHGGGVVIKKVCAHCGAYKIENTRDTDSATGTQFHSVEYKDSDDESLEWVASRLMEAAEKILDECDEVESYERKDHELTVFPTDAVSDLDEFIEQLQDKLGDAYLMIHFEPTKEQEAILVFLK